MKHVPTVAWRELRSLFVSPVAYGVLSLFAVLAGLFFVLGVAAFNAYVTQLEQFQALDQLAGRIAIYAQPRREHALIDVRLAHHLVDIGDLGPDVHLHAVAVAGIALAGRRAGDLGRALRPDGAGRVDDLRGGRNRRAAG